MEWLIVMSFSKIVKQEIMKKEFNHPAKQAILLGLIKSLAIFNSKQLIFECSNKTVAIFVKKLIAEIYNYYLEILTMGIKTIIYKLDLSHIVSLIINDKDISYDIKRNELVVNFERLTSEISKRAFIAGVFIATGSVNSPRISNYHLEIQGIDILFIRKLQLLINSFGFKFKRIYRRKKPLIYLKKSTEIADFLKLIDASLSLLSFENERISRDMYNSINRLTNIEISNQQKTNKAAIEQIKMINFLKANDYFLKLSLKTQQIANLRLDNPEASLNELCDLYENIYHGMISKSGINHMMREIKNSYLLLKSIASDDN
ncbi:DNA-binding protein WhiA [Spiroplasma endosymbiont of Clivina fossor]|uniref:DNA-binding protein WhiA n=1 Tax=Spiroplasma endosymbiont of Clivina fossor TaxID=3066282 RepID=UPI00313C3B06